MDDKKDILLHACCGICAGYPIEYLKSIGYNPVVYFSNDNIDTEAEYNRRQEALIELCKNSQTEYVIEKYNHQKFLERISGLEIEPERGKRCDECIKMRLEHSAQYAKQKGFKRYTTTLVISPHKNYDKITLLGEEIGKKYDIEYIGINFKKQDGFLKTNNISKNLGLYRQNYCGCEFAKGHLKVEE